jgi:localization factor PodJL
MNSRGSSSDDGIEPSDREGADAAAQRAGVSRNDGLSSDAGGFIPDPTQPVVSSQDDRDMADIHQRLDSITRQIDQLSSPAANGEPAVARQLNDAISRLDARLARVAAQTPTENTQQHAYRADRGVAEVYNRSPSSESVTLEVAIAEVIARQHELDETSRTSSSYSSAPAASAMRTPRPAADFSGLERQLFKITSQIESLQRPDGIEQSIAAFRIELAGLRHVITEAMPRRAIEPIENEIRLLSRRIDEIRQNGSDGQALANIERSLNEIYDALRSLKPAEQLAGFDDAIRNLGSKIDAIVKGSGDRGTMQIENAIDALRGLVSNVASNDALARLSDELNILSSKVDQLGRPESHGDSLSALEQRVAALTETLENHESPASGSSSEQLEEAVRALSERLDRLPAGHDSFSALAHLEQRVSLLLERLEAAGEHSEPNLGRVEEGLQDILQYLERQQTGLAAMAENGPRSAGPTMDSEVVEAIKRELSEMRFCQSESDRHTQDSLEAVHSTLEHVVDRLAMIESDLRAVRAQPVRAEPSHDGMPKQATGLPPKPELPNPVLSQMATQSAPTVTATAAPIPRAMADVLIPKNTIDPDRVAQSATASSPRPAVDPELAPDHPLEPGTRPAGRAASPSERIAASESAIGDVAEASREQSGSSFIAAARRAAKAAAAAGPPPDKGGRTKVAIEPARPATGGSNITSKVRSLLVAASVVVIVLSSFKFAMTLLDGSPGETLSESGPAAPVTKPPADAEAGPGPGTETPPSPSMIAPTPIDRHSMIAPSAGDSAAPTANPSDAAPASQPETKSADVTGTVPDAHTLEPAATPPSESLPESIGGATLRTAALHGDAAAAFEVGVRYAEGKGVTVNYDEAAKWYERAAHAGIVPAMFRLGTLHEKGLGTSKDVDTARRYYMQAADRGNAKAMHNLAVLDADGGGKGANYTSAAQWFHKAAERGIADSQFNLGILYARGIGVEQNLAKSYKWFSLAAAQGDVDSGRKRDEVAKRLDPQSLAAAKLAVQTFAPTPQPDDAVNVPSPAGGWDSATAKPHAKAAPRKSATANPTIARNIAR